jgi:hypothetical protein
VVQSGCPPPPPRPGGADIYDAYTRLTLSHLFTVTSGAGARSVLTSLRLDAVSLRHGKGSLVNSSSKVGTVPETSQVENSWK